jgi:hypothetical protein
MVSIVRQGLLTSSWCPCRKRQGLRIVRQLPIVDCMVRDGKIMHERGLNVQKLERITPRREPENANRAMIAG